jgi:hypothetical protein
MYTMLNICLYFFALLLTVHEIQYLCYLVYFPVFIRRLGYLFLFYLRTSASFLSSLIGMIIISCFLLLAYMNCDVKHYF